MPLSNTLKGSLYALICIALWALIPVVAKLGQTGLDHYQFLLYSNAVSFAAIALFVLISGRAKHFRHYTVKDYCYCALLGLLGAYFYYLFLYFGYANAVGLTVLVVQYTWPIFIVLFSVLLFKERLTRRVSVAIALGFIGVALVLTRGDVSQIKVENAQVIAWVAVGAACFALFSVLSRQVKQNPLSAVVIYFFSAGVASLFSVLVFSEFAVPSAQEMFPILLNGVLVNGFSYVFWILALRLVNASYLASLVFMTPILSALYLIVFFDEEFVAAYGIGFILVITAGIMTVRHKK